MWEPIYMQQSGSLSFCRPLGRIHSFEGIGVYLSAANLRRQPDAGAKAVTERALRHGDGRAAPVAEHPRLGRNRKRHAGHVFELSSGQLDGTTH